MSASLQTTRVMLQCCRLGRTLGGDLNKGSRVNWRCLVSAADIPQRPKKPAGTFMIYSLEKRQQVIDENPHLSFPEIAKVVGKMWRELSEDEKEPYRLQARQNMEDYMEEMETFKASLTEDEEKILEEKAQQAKSNKAKRKHKQELKKLDKPKRPLTAFSFFLQSKLKNVSGNATDNITAVSKEWKEMSDEEKTTYYESAAKAKVDYEATMELWESKMEKQGNTSLIRKNKPRRRSTDTEEPPF